MPGFANKRFRWMFILILLAGLFSGCTSDITSTQPVKSTETPAPTVASTDSGYPAPGLAEDPSSAYPAGAGIAMQAEPVNLEDVIAPGEAPQPEAGKASASGVVYSLLSRTILSDFQLYFTPAQGDTREEVPPLLLGAFSNKGDILVKTDSQGVFQVNNIPPGNYYIVLVAPGDYLIAVNSAVDTTPRMVTFQAEQIQPLGVVIFP